MTQAPEYLVPKSLTSPTVENDFTDLAKITLPNGSVIDRPSTWTAEDGDPLREKMILFDVSQLNKLWLPITAVEFHMGLIPQAYSQCRWCRLSTGYNDDGLLDFIPTIYEWTWKEDVTKKDEVTKKEDEVTKKEEEVTEKDEVTKVEDPSVFELKPYSHYFPPPFPQKVIWIEYINIDFAI